MELSSLLDTCSIDSLVRISSLAGDSVVLNVPQGEFPGTTVAAVGAVGFGTVDELLL